MQLSSDVARRRGTKELFAALLALALCGCNQGETVQSVAEDAAADTVEPIQIKVSELENRVVELEERVERYEQSAGRVNMGL